MFQVVIGAPLKVTDDMLKTLNIKIVVPSHKPLDLGYFDSKPRLALLSCHFSCHKFCDNVLVGFSLLHIRFDPYAVPRSKGMLQEIDYSYV
jgi:hypothetical protein